MSTSLPDKIFTINNWYDGPREGVASFQGKPYHYCCLVDYDRDDEPTFYRLTPLDEETFQLEMEDWAIWLRYCAARQEGKATDEMHPALPEDWPRHRELAQLIQAKLTSLLSHGLLATATFGYDSQTVTWTLVEVET